MRISELVGIHAVKGFNVHQSDERQKFLFVLYSSKTHGKESKPQKIKIAALPSYEVRNNICPFTIIKEYIDLRPALLSKEEKFFIFRDYSTPSPGIVRQLLYKILRHIDLDPKYYGTHSFRMGRATDLMKNNVPVDTIKMVGRWKSNAVFKYINVIISCFQSCLAVLKTFG